MLIILGKEKEELLSIFNSLKNKELTEDNISAALTILGNYSELLLIAAASHYRLTTLNALKGRINLSNNLTIAWINHQLDTPIHDQLALPYFNFPTFSKPSDEKLCSLSVLASYSSSIQQTLANKITLAIQHQTFDPSKIFVYFPQIEKDQASLFEKKHGARTLKFIQAIIDNDTYALSQHYTLLWGFKLKSYCVALAADLQRLDILKKLILNKKFPIEGLFLWMERPRNNGYEKHLTSPCIPAINGMVKTFSNPEGPNEPFLSFLSLIMANTKDFNISELAIRDMTSDIVKYSGVNLLKLVIEKFNITPAIEDTINDQSFEMFWWILNYYPPINESDYAAIKRKISYYPKFSKQLCDKLTTIKSPSLPELTFYIYHLKCTTSINQLIKILSICDTQEQLETLYSIFKFNPDIQFEVSYHLYYGLEILKQLVYLYQEKQHLLMPYRNHSLSMMFESIAYFLYLIDGIKNQKNELMNEEIVEHIKYAEERKKENGGKFMFSNIIRDYIIIYDRLDLYLQFNCEKDSLEEIMRIANRYNANKILQYLDQKSDTPHISSMRSTRCIQDKSSIIPFNLFLSEDLNQPASMELRRASL